MKKSLPLTLGVLLLAAAGCLIWSQFVIRAERVRTDSVIQNARIIQERAATARRQADSLGLQLSAQATDPFTGQHYIEKRVAEDLASSGLTGVPDAIVEDLQRQWKILPYNGPSNPWPYKFYSKRDIHVLSGAWVYAKFDNGHNSGDALLEYRTAGAGRIAWRLLSSRFSE